MSCPSLDELAAAHADPGAHAGVVTHVRGGCVPCTDDWHRLDVFVAAARHGALPEVPASLRALALDAPRAAREGVLGRLQTLVGRLVFDSAAHVLAAGQRGAGRRHQLYEAGPYEIDLALVEPATLVGQILGPDDETLADAAVVLSGEGRVLETDVLEHGDFRVPGLASGRYALHVLGPRLDLVLPDVDLTRIEGGV